MCVCACVRALILDASAVGCTVIGGSLFSGSYRDTEAICFSFVSLFMLYRVVFLVGVWYCTSLYTLILYKFSMSSVLTSVLPVFLFF